MKGAPTFSMIKTSKEVAESTMRRARKSRTLPVDRASRDADPVNTVAQEPRTPPTAPRCTWLPESSDCRHAAPVPLVRY